MVKVVTVSCTELTHSASGPAFKLFGDYMFDTVDGSEIPKNPLGMYKNTANKRITNINLPTSTG